MSICPEWLDLYCDVRMAAFRHRMFQSGLVGVAKTLKHKDEEDRLLSKFHVAERALSQHQSEHGCKPDSQTYKLIVDTLRKADPAEQF